MFLVVFAQAENKSEAEAASDGLMPEESAPTGDNPPAVEKQEEAEQEDRCV